MLRLCSAASLQTLGIDGILPVGEQLPSCLFILTHPFSLLQHMEADLAEPQDHVPQQHIGGVSPGNFCLPTQSASSEPSAPTACWQAPVSWSFTLHLVSSLYFSCFHPSSESCPVEILYFPFPINCVSPLSLSWLLFAISQICFPRMEFSFVPQNVLCLTGGIPCCPGRQFV